MIHCILCMPSTMLLKFVRQTMCWFSVVLRSSPVTPAAPASTELAICLSRIRSSAVESSETLCLLISFSRRLIPVIECQQVGVAQTCTPTYPCQVVL